MFTGAATNLTANSARLSDSLPSLGSAPTAKASFQWGTSPGIKANPTAYDGQAMKISGEYRGSEAGHGTPPVSRNDWVIHDDTGYMYVTGNSLGLTYPGDIGKPVTVSGFVRLKNVQPYIEIARK